MLPSWATRSGFNFILIALTPKPLENQIPMKPRFIFQVQTVQKNPELVVIPWKAPHYWLMALYTGRPERCQVSFLPIPSRSCESFTKHINHLLSTCYVLGTVQHSRTMTRQGPCPGGWQLPCWLHRVYRHPESMQVSLFIQGCPSWLRWGSNLPLRSGQAVEKETWRCHISARPDKWAWRRVNRSLPRVVSGQKGPPDRGTSMSKGKQWIAAPRGLF